MCEMESYADAVVGEVGSGLSVEQRKVRTSFEFVETNILTSPSFSV